MGEPGMLGEIRLFAGTFAPETRAYCDGSMLPIPPNTALFSLLGNQYGGDRETNSALPKSVPLPTTGPGATPVHYSVCTEGDYPSRP